MMILWVVPSLAVSILLFALAYGQMRKPNPNPFFEAEPTASAFAMLITGLLALALAGIAMNFELLWQSFLALSMPGRTALLSLPVGAILVAPLLMRPARRALPSHRNSAEIVHLPPRGPSQTGRTPPASGTKPRRRAA